MTIPTVAIFNPTSGAGKTFLVYHLAWMYRDLELEVIAADLDPQAELTALFLDEDSLEKRWQSKTEPKTVFQAIERLKPQDIEEQLTLINGDISLLAFEDEFSKAWHLPPNEESNQILSAFWQHLQTVATEQAANIILIDLGSNLGAINRACLIAADYVVVPLIPDLFSVHGLKQLGAMRRQWHDEWQRRRENHPKLPVGKMQGLGYVIIQQPIRLYLGANNYAKWMMQMPSVFHDAINKDTEEQTFSLKDDPCCLNIFKTYYSLIPLAKEARKPIFHLKPADGAMGAYGELIPSAYREFQQLASKIAKLAGIVLPENNYMPR
ncbi:MAG: AAA family ATPase [Pseudomonadota bacterium]